jgi:prophage antirepressor-like protein
VLKLPDPTPREIDPSLRNHTEDPAAAAARRRAVAAQNEKRRQLIVWATNELVVLSERADKAASAPAGDASKAELAANVNKIEVVAKNLAAAMKAQ